MTRGRHSPLLLGAVLLAAGVGVLPVLLAFLGILSDPVDALRGVCDSLLWERLARSAWIAGLSLLVMVPVGLGMGWLLARSNLPGRGLLLMLAPWPLFLPPLVHVLSWFGVAGLSGVPAIVVVYAISFTPFVVLLSARALDLVSRSHAETLELIGGRRAVLFDDLRQAWPAALTGGGLALVFLLGDFAVADFLTSVGPSVTVYADTLYAHSGGARDGAAAAAALPGLAACLALLLGAFARRRALGVSIGSRFERAEPVRLGGWTVPLLILAAGVIAAGTLLPFVSLLIQTGSLSLLLELASRAGDRILFTLGVGSLAATGMVLLGLPLALLSLRLRRPWKLDLLIVLPLAVPPLILGVGLIRAWNRPGLDAIYTGIGVVLLAMIGRYLAFAYLPLCGALERIDPALDHAAELGGARPVSRFFGVLLPTIASPILAAWCVSFCFTLRELDTLIMLRAGQRSLTHHLYENVVFARQDEVAGLALILAGVTIAPLLLYLLLSRRALRFL